MDLLYSGGQNVAEWSHVVRDLDGTFAGTPGYAFVSNDPQMRDSTCRPAAGNVGYPLLHLLQYMYVVLFYLIGVDTFALTPILR